MASPTSQEHKETGRIEAFSDGVFAVAITLLILTIQVPKVSDLKTHSLFSYVLDQWPFFLAYLVSFMSILVMWSNHHGVFNLVVRTDRRLLIINGLLLLLITFVNYPTAIVAAAITENNPADQKFAVMFYTGTLIVFTIVFQIFWFYLAAHRNLLDEHVDPTIIQRISHEYRFGPLFYLVAFGLAYIQPIAGILAALALAIYFSVTARVEPVHSPNSSGPSLDADA